MDAAPPVPPSLTKRSTRSKAPANLDTVHAQHQAGKTTRELGAQYGVAHTTIQRWLDAHQHEQRGIQQYKTSRADIFARIQAKSLRLQEALIEELMEDRLSGLLTPTQKAGMLQSLNVVSGTLYDKERLETGQSTANISTISRMVDGQVSTLYKRTSQAVDSIGHSAPKEGATGHSENSEPRETT